MFVIIPHKVLCCAYRCPNSKQKKDRFCSKHRHRYNKINNPVQYTYNALKSNARRRRKFFDLTIEQFRSFCEKNNYMELKGKTGASASIDCIIAAKGYTEGNIRILSISENSRKGAKDEVPF